MGKYGVTVNAIAPVAGTRMTLDEGVKAGFRKRYEAGLITKEKLEQLLSTPGPEFIAPMVGYLASDAAADINGQVFRVEKERIGIYNMPVEIKAIHREDDGMWTMEEIETLAPPKLLDDYVNPAPKKT
jgi:3-oxoacyl-[acyl-carrier protein] reductase